MAARKSAADYEASPAEALAKWQGQRYASRADYENLLNERENRILSLSEKSGPHSDKYLNTKRDLDKAEREAERIHAVVRRPLSRWAIPFWVLLAFALALAFFEAPVNKFLFDVALQSSNLASWTISFGFACALLLLAHIAGFSLRHVWSEVRKRIVWSSLVIFLLMVFALLVLVGILTIARASFSAEAGSIRELLTNVTSTIQSVGVWGALRNALSDMSALVLATVNIGGIFMTMMLSFFTHDPDKDFDAASRQVDRQREKLAKIVKEFIQSKERIVKECAPDLAGHSANYKTANMNVIELKKRLGQSLDEEDHRIIDKSDTMAEESPHWADIERGIADVVSVRGGNNQAAAPLMQGGSRREPKLVAGERGDAR